MAAPFSETRKNSSAHTTASFPEAETFTDGDSEKAKKRLWRIPEATLLTVAALGGSIGCLAGMKVFHHKTRKPKFMVTLPIFLGAHIIVICFLIKNGYLNF